MAEAFVGVGSNLGNRLSNLKKAEALIVKSGRMKILAQSGVYETVPQGGPPQGFFLNAVWKLETSLSPKELLKELQSIELILGRKREITNGPRTIDLDILDYDGLILDSPDLILPHPRLHEREFVLRALHNIQPDWAHPWLKKSVKELWMELQNENLKTAG